MSRILVIAITLNWAALIAGFAMIFNAGDAIAPQAASMALFQLGCLSVAIAMLTARGALSSMESRDHAPKVDHDVMSARMARVMARQTAWLADTDQFGLRRVV